MRRLTSPGQASTRPPARRRAAVPRLSTVTFDSTGLAAGVYTGNLCVTSNDPDPGPGNGTDLVIVPLTLTVQPPTAVTLSNLTADASSVACAVPASLPLAALPAAAGLAMAAVYALRRKGRQVDRWR